MAWKVSSFKKLLEIIRQANSIEFDYTPFELLDSARVHISMDVVICMQEVQSEHDRMCDVE